MKDVREDKKAELLNDLTF
jgi:hypothetical protein